MERLQLLLDRLRNIAPYLRGDTISVTVSKDNVEVDMGYVDASTAKKVATHLFHQTYTNFKKSS